MPKISAGIVLYNIDLEGLRFFLVHPGGPFFKKKQLGWWTIPKGEPSPNENPLSAAIREFEEETGYKPQNPFIELDPIRQKAGKLVYAWAASGYLDTADFVCNQFEIEWPPRSGKRVHFPEIDKAGWFSLDDSRKHIIPEQFPLLQQTFEIIIEKSRSDVRDFNNQ